MYGQGISRDGEIVDAAVKLDIIQKSGAWFSYGEMRLGQGRDNVKLYLREHPDFAEDVARQVMERKEELAGIGKGSKKINRITRGAPVSVQLEADDKPDAAAKPEEAE